MRGFRQLWADYWTWRSTPGKKPPEPPATIRKIDASDGDIAVHVTSNMTGDSSGT